MAGKQQGKSNTEMQINLSALKKHDQNIQQIIDTASSVAHYKFNPNSGVWEKTEVEGSLFLYSRKTSPFVIIFIMNRLNKDNAKLTLTSGMEFKIQEPFLLCKASNSEIIGIWFYDGAECRRFGALLGRFSVLAKDERSLQIAIMMEAQKNEKSNDSKNGIIDMFTQAQNEYSKSRSKFSQGKPMQQQEHKNNPKEQQNKLHQVARQISEPNLRSLDKSLNEIKISTKQLDEEQMRKQRERFKGQHKKEQEVLFNILHGNNKSRTRTVSSGNDFDVQRELNKDTKLRSNAGDLATFNDLDIICEQNLSKAIDCAELELQFSQRNKSGSMFNQADSLGRIMNVTNSVNTGSLDVDKTEMVNSKITNTTVPSNMLTSASVAAIQGIRNIKPGISSLSPLTGSSHNSISAFATHSSSSLHVLPTSNVSNQLLSPHLMSAGKGRGTTLNALVNGQHNIAIAANFKQGNKSNKILIRDNIKSESNTKGKFPEAPSLAALNSLMAPAAFQLTSQNVSKVVEVSEFSATLTKEQFKNFLLDMIQNDNEFVSKLHDAFLEQLRKR